MQLFKAGAFIFLVLSLHTQTALAETCFSQQDLDEISEEFFQVRNLTVEKQTNCVNDNDWATLIQALVDLKNMAVEEDKEFQTKDDFSKKAIQDNGWWSYFTKRADSFLIHQKCSPGVVAYVQPWFTPGVVNLCPPYFEKEGRIGKVETLLHEVRHFDGMGHVTCERGADKGVSGACDVNINDKGSYAVSVQASVTLGLKGKGFLDSEKSLARASALYLIHNRFNVETEVKVRESLYLESEDGTVFDWAPSEGVQLQEVTKLSAPAHIYTMSMDTTIYPFDHSIPAYRKADDFQLDKSAIGMYAEDYNSKSVQDRLKYKSHSYHLGGGIITEDGFSSLCGSGLTQITKDQLPEDLEKFVTLKKEGPNPVDYALGTSGALYFIECHSSSGKLSLSSTGLRAPTNLLKTAMVKGQAYALTASGDLVEVDQREDVFSFGKSIKFSGAEQKWIEIAARIMPYIYDEAK